MRDRYALAECLQAYTERVGPLLGKTQGLHAAYLAGEEGESTLAIVTLFWTTREAAVAWLNAAATKRFRNLASLQPREVIVSSSALSTNTKRFDATSSIKTRSIEPASFIHKKPF